MNTVTDNGAEAAKALPAREPESNQEEVAVFIDGVLRNLKGKFESLSSQILTRSTPESLTQQWTLWVSVWTSLNNPFKNCSTILNEKCQQSVGYVNVYNNTRGFQW